MTPAELRTRGMILYGVQWQTPLARNVGVSPRTVRYWVAGEVRIGKAHETAINRLLARRIRICRAALTPAISSR